MKKYSKLALGIIIPVLALFLFYLMQSDSSLKKQYRKSVSNKDSMFFDRAFSVSKKQYANIALKKNYKFSKMPDYRNPDLSIVNESLTDGIKSYESNRSFWVQKTTAGWSHIKKPSILIDLEKSYLINSIRFNTVGGGRAGVYFPLHVLAYVSIDGENFEYVGDLLESNFNTSKSYEVKNFDLNNINLAGRYVRLDIIPNGAYVFCNEIEIYGTGQDIAEAQGAFTTQSVIKERASTPFVVEKTKPWKSYFHLNIPQINVSTLNYNYLLAKNTSQLESIKITNTSGTIQTLNFELSNSNLLNIKMFEAPFIDASKAIKIIDPLLPLPPSSTVNIQPGETKILFLKLTGLQTGNDEIALEISNANKIVTVHYNINVLELPDNTPFLNAINWAYFFRPVLSGRKAEAIKDLEAHHINTYVIASRDIPSVGNTDFSKLTDYVSGLPRDSNLLLFLNFEHAKIRNISGTIKFMEEEWKPLFKQWYSKLLQSLISMGFDKNNIYFYPYDEPAGDDVKNYLAFAKWGSQNVDNLQFFSTVSKESALPLKQYLDIVCISEFLSFESKKEAQRFKKGSWFYRLLSRSRDRNPYIDYRLMSWKAFYYDLEGVGFWNYATLDNRPDNNLMTGTYKNPRGDYSVIYTKENSADIITSRRWEAFSIGLEDYRIISAYAQKTSISEAKTLVLQVINKPHNYQLADSVRQIMLNEIR